LNSIEEEMAREMRGEKKEETEKRESHQLHGIRLRR
jgi:hypothetical protein